MQIKFTFILCLCIFQLTKINAQIDLGFDTIIWPDPFWFGSTSKFDVENGYLQLLDSNPQSTNESQIFLNAPTSLDSLTSWYFDWKMDFSPSSSNYAKLWMACNLINDQIIEGYYLKMGGESGAVDALKLIYFDGEEYIELGSSNPGYMHGSNVHRQVKVVHMPNGLWEVYSKIPTDQEFELLFVVEHFVDHNLTTLALECNYTVSRNEHFFLDSLYVDPIYIDTDAPQLNEWSSSAGSSVVLEFSESVLLENPVFTLNSAVVQLDFYLIDNTVEIYLDGLVNDGAYFNLFIEGVSDIHSNYSDLIVVSGFFQDISIPKLGNLIINEIYFEPSSGSNPLAPEWEFIELYNPTDKTLDASELIIEVNGTNTLIDLGNLEPKSFSVISSSDDITNLDHFYALESFPSLPNSGALITIKTEDTTIDQFYYSPEYYRDQDRDNGGFSLEKVNPSNTCLGYENWRVCQNLQGVSPGFANSIIDTTFYPTFEFSFLELDMDAHSFLLEASHRLSDPVAENELVVDTLLEVAEMNLYYDQTQKIEVLFNNTLSVGQVYSLQALDSIALCDASMIEVDTQVYFGLGKAIQFGDLEINEVLSDPVLGCEPYIELSNESGQLLDGRGLFLQFESGQSSFVFTLDLPLIFPKDFPVLVPDSISFSSCYDKVIQKSLFVCEDFKSIDKDSFSLDLFVVQPNFELIHISSMDYSLIDTGIEDYSKGKSYERLIDGQWLLASAPDYGTPTRPNSKPKILNAASDQPFSLNPPLLMGNQVFLNLNYLREAKGSAFDFSIIYPGNPRIFNLEQDVYLSGAGNYILEQIPLSVLVNGIYLLIVQEREGQGKGEKWLIPFFVYL